MLKLEKMEVAGFKSFSDRTSVEFREGITAVVGPNGCGKSNIGDAINWVLGEQSPRMLRGRQMADVIFSGSAARKAQGLAEVSLHLNSTNGSGQNRIVLTRRLFRSGESEYLLNGAKARLKDIEEILRNEKVGAKTYATIEQGRIDQIINAKPRELRLIIEEAAGVAGFKHKRRLTELKLDATQANLYRVNDIVAEVRRQINSLKRQAAKARRYQRLRDEMRERQRTRFALRARQMDEELARLKRLEHEEGSREAELSAKLGAIEADLAERRNDLEAAERGYRELAERIHAREVEIGREEGRVRVSRERIEESGQVSAKLEAEAATLAERREGVAEQVRAHQQTSRAGHDDLEQATRALATCQEALAEADRGLQDRRREAEALRARQFEVLSRVSETRNRRRAVLDAIERTKRQRERLLAEQRSAGEERTRLDGESRELDHAVEQLRSRIAKLEATRGEIDERLAAARREHAGLVESAAAAREREKSAAARLRTLEDVSTRFAGVSDGVRALLSKGEAAGVRARGVIADFVEAGREIESAAEAYLEDLLPAVILEDDEDARRAVDLLRTEGAGRTALVCRSQPAGALAVGSPTNGSETFAEELLADPRVKGRLRERLTLNTAVNGVLKDRIGDAVLVDGLASALELHRRHPGVDFLTPEGEVVYASGMVLAGGKGADNGMLAHARRIQETQAEAAALEGRAEELAARLARSAQERDRLEEEQRRAREALEEARREQVTLSLRAETSAEARQRTERRDGVIRDELAMADQEAAALDEQLSQCRREEREAEEALETVGGDLERQAVRVDEHEAERNRLAEQVAEKRADVAARRQHAQALEVEGARLAEALEEIGGRIDALRGEAELARRRGQQAGTELERVEADLVRHLAERERDAAALAELDRGIGESRLTLQERERSAVAVRRELEGVQGRVRNTETERARAESDRRHLDELCREELNLSASEAAGLVDDQRLADAETGALEQEIAELRAKIEGIGPVNIMAIEEFSELEERHGFLVAQKDDLEKSMTSLRDSIRRINRTSRERFSEAFDAVRQYYQETFQSLFRGGRADLRLEQGEAEGEADVLECGIQIMAQPPGKRLSSVQLLSGGERAMSAIALLFAIFRYQPSPFCLLDEVDAPLDDVNVGRFTRMLRDYAENTQFILITHNKISMESADLLYGVTMDEPGVSRLISMQLA